jgi:adenosine kinase
MTPALSGEGVFYAMRNLMNIVLTGSVAFDYLMKFPGYFRDHILTDHLETISLSFLVESMTRQRGGIAPNIAYTMAQLGERPRVMATVGQDGVEYREWLDSLGVDVSWMRVVEGVFTASFFANTDRSNAQISSFYPGAMAYAGQLSFHDLDGPRPDLVVISPNDPDAMQRYVSECKQLGLRYVYDPSQQIVRMTGKELSSGIEAAWALFVNEYEFELTKKMTGLTEAEIRGGLEFLVVTCGKEGSRIVVGEQEYCVPAAPVSEIVDPTGVGDAFRGGFLTGLSRGFDWETCGQMGALAASYCLEQQGPQGHSYTRAEFVARFRQTFDDQGRLDVLLED